MGEQLDRFEVPPSYTLLVDSIESQVENNNKHSSSRPITVFLDEGALDGDYRFPSACAVLVGDVDLIDQKIESTIHRLLLRPDFSLEPAAKKFRSTGFHHVEDNVLAQNTFLNLLPRLDFHWWCSSDLQPPADPYVALPNQFEWIVHKILQKLKDKRVHFVFEQNERLNRQFSSIVESAVKKAKYDPQLVTFSIGTKKNRALAIADYCIAIATQAISVWMDACCDVSKLHRKYQYRTFASIEPLCSVLFSSNLNRSISSRSSTRLGDKSYFQLAGRHNTTCGQKASSEVSF